MPLTNGSTSMSSMTYRAVYLLGLLVVCWCTAGSAFNDSAHKSNISESTDGLSAISKRFIDVVHPEPNTILTLLPILDINVKTAKVPSSLNRTAILAIIVPKLSPILKHYAGYVVALVFGLIFVIVMLLSCFCYCLCRMIGRCGGSLHKKPGGKEDRLPRIILGLLLLVVTILLLVGTLYSFFNAKLLLDQLSNVTTPVEVSAATQPGLLHVAHNTVESVFDYGTSILQDVIDFVTSVNEIGNILISPVLKTTVNAIGTNVAGLNDTMKSAVILQTAILQINSTLAGVQRAGQQLSSLQSQVKTSLNSVKTAVLAAMAVGPCTANDTDCNNIRNDITAMMLNPDFDKLPDSTQALTTIKNSLDTNGTIKSLATNDIVKSNFDFLIDLINPALDAVATGMKRIVKVLTAAQNSSSQNQGRTKRALLSGNAIKTALPLVTAALNQLFDTFIAELQPIVQLFVKLKNKLIGVEMNIGESLEPSLSTIRHLLSLVVVLVGLAMLLVAVLNILGLFFGSVCPLPTQKKGSSFCTRKLGAALLNVSVCSSFIVAGIVMLLTMVVFLVGGLLYSELCRDLVKERNSVLIANADNVANQFVPTVPRLNLSFSVKDVIFSKCQNDTGIVQVLNFQPTTDKLMKGIGLALKIILVINPFKPLPGNLTKIHVNTPTVRADLTNIQNTLAKYSTSALFDVQFNRTLTNKDLNAVAKDLESFTKGNVTVCKAQAAILRKLASGQMAQIPTVIAEMKIALGTLSQKLSAGTPTISGRIDALLKSLLAVQTSINNLPASASANLTKLHEALNRGGTDLIADMSNQVDTLGGCQPVTDVVGDVVNALCKNLLNPINSMWVIYCWCALMFIPSVILGAILSGMYARMPPDEEQEEESKKVPFYLIIPQAVNKLREKLGKSDPSGKTIKDTQKADYGTMGNSTEGVATKEPESGEGQKFGEDAAVTDADVTQ